MYTDLCGPSHLPSGLFRHLMVLINISSIWSHVCLLLSRNLMFAKMLAQIICYMHNFLQISSFNDGIMTHLKGAVIEKK